MNGSITLHPTKGVNCHMTFCPRCGGDGRELVMLGNKNKKVVCACGWTAYGFSSPDSIKFDDKPVYNCPHCKKPLTASWTKVVEIDEYEKLPGGLCESCEKELAEHAAIVESGGVYFRCQKCKVSGVIKPNEFTSRVRAANDMNTPNEKGEFKPCGVEFESCEQHGGKS